MKYKTFGHLLIKSESMIISLLLVFAANSIVSAQVCKLRLGGQVTRSSERGPLPQARVPVNLLNEKGEKTTVRTDHNGDYVFAGLCPGRYTVYPGPVLVESENSPVPSLYTPAFKKIRIPAPENQLSNTAHIDFLRKEPPPRKSDDYEQKSNETINIDEMTRAGQDLNIAGRVKEFLLKNIRNPNDPRYCQLTIRVNNGHVELAGRLKSDQKMALEKIRDHVGQVKSVNLDMVRIDPAR